jgi:hypothetical protein
MEKTNIAELLKGCPKGMELDCALFDGVHLEEIIDDEDIDYPILIKTKEGETWNITSEGCWDDSPSAKCIIFPKGKNTWEGFVPPCQFKDGDVISDGTFIAIFHKFEDGHLYYRCWHHKTTKESKYKTDFGIGYYYEYTYATEEEKEKLFQAIKDNGYRWNAESKTLEKIIEPKFKVGDIIQDEDGNKVKITEVNIEDECYGYESMITKVTANIVFSKQDKLELVPNKFDIATLKPFDKVLARDTGNSMWIAALFSHLRGMTFYTVGGWYNQCIPFEGNEHLLGTTDECTYFYKIWE